MRAVCRDDGCPGFSGGWYLEVRISTRLKKSSFGVNLTSDRAVVKAGAASVGARASFLWAERPTGSDFGR